MHLFPKFGRCLADCNPKYTLKTLIYIYDCIYIYPVKCIIEIVVNVESILFIQQKILYVIQLTRL